VNVLIYGDSKYPALRHEVPVTLPDPIAYIEQDGERTIVAGSLDVPRLQALGGYRVISFEESGLAELMGQGVALGDAIRGCVVRACARLRVREAVVPSDLPVELADELRAAGIAVRPDGALLDLRRRSKTAFELAGIRRAQRAAEATMQHVRERLREGGSNVEEIRAGAQHVFIDHGCVPHDMLVIAPGAQGADPHDQGSGPILQGVPIVVDIFPRDMESGCWGDITRTFCVGEAPDELASWHAAVREAQQRATVAIRPGIGAGELNRIARQQGQSLAALVREAVDGYLDRSGPDAETALASTYGRLPQLEVPARDEWDRG
jgi:Xaa-Pro aminopeptidase